MTDAHVEVLLDLRRGQRVAVQCDHLDLPRPRAVTRDFVAENKGKGIVPDAANRGRAGDRVDQVVDQLTVDVNTAAVERIVIDHDVLQAGLGQFFVILSGG